MLLRNKIISFLYKHIFKPLAFRQEPEKMHDTMTRIGEYLENSESVLHFLFPSPEKNISKKVLGVLFENPVGLAAGFDYDGHLAQTMKYIGFGFNTVGTVTAKPYGGNKQPRLVRLPKSQSILVNKGFKSEGADAIGKRLDAKKLAGHTIGISVGSSNIAEVDTISKAIEDYVYTFSVFKNKKYVKYFELNISCPNTILLKEPFVNRKNFRSLVDAVVSLHIKQPIFVKMPNEIDFDHSDDLIHIAEKKGIRGFIFSNLVKDRKNPMLDAEEIRKFGSYPGGFSGKPAFANSNSLITHSRKKFGKNIAIIGCGGIFSPEDAMQKLSSGADLIQLVTGMIYQGPQLVGEINSSLAFQS